jgi:hypothetical protein
MRPTWLAQGPLNHNWIQSHEGDRDAVDRYSNGLFSFSKIERATYLDVSVRYLTAGTDPEYDTICTFSRENLSATSVAFVDILPLG